MKFRGILAAGLCAAALVASGCALAPVTPARGLIYSNQGAPLFPGGKPGAKIGKATSHNVLFLVSWGDSGLDAAMKDGGISDVAHVDYEVQNIFFIYQNYTTVVRGN